MEKFKRVEFEVSGKQALFSTPNSSMNGYKVSYLVPTYSAITGILENIYWKPTIKYVIEAVRVMHEIRTEEYSVLHLRETKRMKQQGIHEHLQPTYVNERLKASYTVLKDVKYQVRARFEFNEEREDLKEDRNVEKHSNMLQRSLKRGGRYDIWLGTTDCPGYVKPCKFGEDEGFYDNSGTITFEKMFHSFQYSNGRRVGINEFIEPVMKNGIIQF
ncbi:type I-C CRISPR-associated protein Cas5c [Caryophanon latum]|uniref:pre-crRNA processing endonuclease n=1 Tax=Caryophanon latum TaxID=33977 RepID=A0A1C0YV26_9BACL|nr:type I-C CRISPR-associated protein Cas5c [Caryophanon latum]OCS90991.1 type I-C CRISPR-associated protein Cas5 [Caryophanon latum]